jgi:tyrosinase
MDHADLTPFWNSQTHYWESSGVTTTAPLGYSYPEFNGLNLNDPNAVRTAIAQKVNQLYGGSTVNGPRVVSAAKAAAPVVAQDFKSSAAPAPEPSHSNPHPHPAARAVPDQEAQVNIAHAPGHNVDEKKLWEWTARIHVKKYEVGGSFLVLLFLGSVPENPRQWRTSANFVGAHHVFANRCVQFFSLPGLRIAR